MSRTRKNIPTKSVRRTVFLNYKALSWALATMRDDKASVEKRGAMDGSWKESYEEAEAHLLDLMRQARV